LALSEPKTPNIANPEYTFTPEKQDMDPKALLMMMMEDYKDINNSLKEIQENAGKQVKALQVESQKSLKMLQENTTKQVKELNKTIQDLKMKVETIKKS
jgi:FtsZ-binding cell division protein ZapB